MGHSMTLILGGARSGKSDYALRLAKHDGGKVLFVATALASDEEMQARITAHRSNRPVNWKTIEAPVHVGEAIRAALPTEWVLLDCMTLLINNILLSLPEPVVESDFDDLVNEELKSLFDTISMSQSKWVIVSNEVGLGLVPPYPLGRLFRDGLGRANQSLAQIADSVIFMVAGIPMLVKGVAPNLY
jgi:adenosylcobinamide kinase/adenosylcobinamide-phosphate guanylyltransferase